MPLTRKHYKAVAAVLAEQAAQHDYTSSAKDVIGTITHNLADVFEDDNPRFNRERFLKAARNTTE